MAQAPREILLKLQGAFNQLSNARKVGLIVGIAGLISLLVVLTISSRTPDYRVLFSNISDKDGGAIIAQLSQMNVPYKIAEGGGAILVPDDVVYKTRLQLATQGLPKGGGVGFELLEAPKFGESSEDKTVKFQRALEGELARTIRSLQEIEDARVHLAVPRQTVFIRENQKPSASVLVSMHPGRVLDPAQVSGIVHLIASSVPELSPRAVTVVDQSGTLLSGPSDDATAAGLDRTQLKFVRQVEKSYVDRIENILKPITGPDNVRAQVAAALDFSEVEQTSETYRPNNDPKDQAMRSQQLTENQSQTPQPPQGVPGALSNTPPGAAAAPLVAPQPAAANANGTIPMATTSQKDTRINFEVDKTIRHTKGEIGTLKRLSVAVVVNYKRLIEGETTKFVPFTEQEMGQIQNLVREAMGYDKARGDTVNVVNAQFRGPADEVSVAWWKDPGFWLEKLGANAATLLALAFAFAFLWIIRSGVKEFIRVSTPPEPAPAAAGAEGGEVALEGEGAPGGVAGEGGQAAGEGAEPVPKEESEYERNIRLVREMARDNPRLVAQIIKDWVTKDE